MSSVFFDNIHRQSYKTRPSPYLGREVEKERSEETKLVEREKSYTKWEEKVHNVDSELPIFGLRTDVSNQKLTAYLKQEGGADSGDEDHNDTTNNDEDDDGDAGDHDQEEYTDGDEEEEDGSADDDYYLDEDLAAAAARINEGDMYEVMGGMEPRHDQSADGAQEGTDLDDDDRLFEGMGSLDPPQGQSSNVASPNWQLSYDAMASEANEPPPARTGGFAAGGGGAIPLQFDDDDDNQEDDDDDAMALDD
eukprot:scpid85120/ scgid22963/ 